MIELKFLAVCYKYIITIQKPLTIALVNVEIIDIDELKYAELKN